jgi:hypothetical protein
MDFGCIFKYLCIFQSLIVLGYFAICYWDLLVNYNEDRQPNLSEEVS